MRRPAVRYAGIAAAVLVVAAVGVAAFLSLQTPFQPPAQAPGSTPCTPHPCLNVRGYIVWVSNLKVESGLVSMQLTFRNSSAATHADPADLQLIDSQNQTSKAVYDSPGCPHWPRTDFSNGATFGPVTECFRPASTAPPLVLRWYPDLGLFCCQVDLVLVPPGGSQAA